MERSLEGNYRKLIFQKNNMCVPNGQNVWKAVHDYIPSTIVDGLLAQSVNLFNKAGKKWLNNILIDF